MQRNSHFQMKCLLQIVHDPFFLIAQGVKAANGSHIFMRVGNRNRMIYLLQHLNVIPRALCNALRFDQLAVFLKVFDPLVKLFLQILDAACNLSLGVT